MNVICNDSPLELREGARLLDLLQQLSLEARGVALAVDDVLVPRSRWTDFTLQEGQRVTLIQAAQGG
ncbi:MAG TPA: sulfur carrier protein ThiS [Fibrobacteraceae bacterium]|nr:sulfur carrier protein ThiS [Fibrobacteraceae bacterium]